MGIVSFITTPHGLEWARLTRDHMGPDTDAMTDASREGLPRQSERPRGEIKGDIH
jgi:hypothetical protein